MAAIKIDKELQLTDEQVKYCRDIAKALPDFLTAVVLWSDLGRPRMIIKSELSTEFPVDVKVPVQIVVDAVLQNKSSVYKRMTDELLVGGGIPTNDQGAIK